VTWLRTMVGRAEANICNGMRWDLWSLSNEAEFHSLDIELPSGIYNYKVTKLVLRSMACRIEIQEWNGKGCLFNIERPPLRPVIILSSNGLMLWPMGRGGVTSLFCFLLNSIPRSSSPVKRMPQRIDLLSTPAIENPGVGLAINDVFLSLQLRSLMSNRPNFPSLLWIDSIKLSLPANNNLDFVFQRSRFEDGEHC